MGIDRNKVQASAQKQLAKGNYDKAIAEYRKLIQEDPSDVRTWLKIANIYQRKGSIKEATATYEKVAKRFADQGFFLKAVAVYKQILELHPDRPDISLRLAEMYEQLQLVSDALQTYDSIAAQYDRAGDTDHALKTLKRMVTLDPKNVAVRIRHAEALSRAGHRDDAASEFEIGADLLKDLGREDDYLKVAERLSYHRPDDVRLARELAESYLKRRDAKRALAKLQTCLAHDQQDVDSLGLLADAFELLGQIPKTVSVHKEIARIHRDSGRPADHARSLQKVLSFAPGDAEARQALATYAPGSVAKPVDSLPGRAVVESIDDEPILEVVDDDEDLLIMDEDEFDDSTDFGPDDHTAADNPRAAQRTSADIELDIAEEVIELEQDDDLLGAVESVHDQPLEPSSSSIHAPPAPGIPEDLAQDAQIARLLTECDVFERYGLKEKVVSQLEMVVQLDHTHVEARERLKEAYLDVGRIPDAIGQLRSLIELFRGRPQVASLYEKQLAELEAAQENVAVGVEVPDQEFDVAFEGEDVVFMDDEQPDPNDLETNELPTHDMTVMQASPFSGDDLDDFRNDSEIPLFGESDPSELASPGSSVHPPLRLDELPKAPAPKITAPPAHITAPPPLAPPKPLPVTAPPPVTAAPVAAPQAVTAPPPVAPAIGAPPAVATSANPAAPLIDAPDASALDPSSTEIPQGPPSSPSPIPASVLDLDEDLEDEHDKPTIPPNAATDPEVVAPSDTDPPSDSMELEPEATAATAELESSETKAEPPPSNEIENLAAELPIESELPPDVVELFEEAEFYQAQGLFGEALASLEEALEDHPELDAIQLRIEALRAEQASRPKSMPPSKAPEEDLAFALAEKLADELGEEAEIGGDVLDVDAVFEQFKAGVAAQVGEGDSDTHFDLGIAYKEMGLLDDAVSEFELAKKNPVKECIAYTMIGLCRMEQRKFTDAIGFFKRGLYSDRKTDREEIGLYFELAEAYAALEDPKEALFYYEKVRRRDPKFRGVSDRINHLSGQSSSPEVIALDLDE